VRVFGLSNDPPSENKAFKDKFSYPFDLLCDVDKKFTTEIGLYGEQEWKGKKFQGLGRATLLIDGNGRLRSVVQGVPPQNHADEILKEVPRV
jgi:peroxiredoxin Q/BCP